VNLVCPCCPWFVLAPKVLQLRINHLVWVLCRPMWVSEACQLILVPSRSSSTPLYPLKCYELGSVPQLLLLPLFFTWTHIWIFQGVGSVLTLVRNICICLSKKGPTWKIIDHKISRKKKRLTLILTCLWHAYILTLGFSKIQTNHSRQRKIYWSTNPIIFWSDEDGHAWVHIVKRYKYMKMTLLFPSLC